MAEAKLRQVVTPGFLVVSCPLLPMFFKYSVFLETDPEHYVDKGWARRAGQFSFCAQRGTCTLHLVNPEAPG